MNIYEKIPQFEAPRELEPGEIQLLTDTIIWPAATYFWGHSYRNPKALDENEPVGRFIESDDISSKDGKPDKVEISFAVAAEYPLTDSGEVDEEAPDDLYVSVAIETYRRDITEIFQNISSREEEVWEVITYDFAWDSTAPLANRYYTFKRDNDEVDTDRLSRRHYDFLKRISRLRRFNPDRSAELNTQDAIDIRNILLALETPAEIIAPNWGAEN